jgi:hypothetical protein
MRASMSLVPAWLAFPAIFTLVSLGCGLLAEWISRGRLPGTLLLPLGWAGIVVTTQLTTWHDATAEASTPSVLAAAALGLWLGRRRLRAAALDRWALAAGTATFLVYAAPVVASGGATFAGYGVLGDTSVHFVLVDHLLAHGRSLADVAPSSYAAALAAYVPPGYPTGPHTALGALRPLAGADVAWVYQPYLALLSAATALVLYELLRPCVGAPSVRAGAAFLAAQPGLVYAYALQGAVKEIAAITLLALVVALTPVLVRPDASLGRVLPSALATSAALATLSIGVLPWLGPILGAQLLAGLWLARRPSRLDRRTALRVASFAVLVTALSAPLLVGVRTFRATAETVLTSPAELGNLVRPLQTRQVLGIWPTGDHRVGVQADALEVWLLIAAAGVSAVVGVAWMVWRRAWVVLLFVGASLLGSAYVTHRGSPWVDAKALVILAPAAVAAAAVGAAALHSARRRVGAALLGGALALGVMWTNALAYHDVSLAPRERLSELGALRPALRGGPALVVEFEEYAKHFLRDSAVVATDYAPRGFLPPAGAPFGFPVDLDALPPSYVERFATLVLRRSPVASRPPASFRLERRGRWYEVWRRSRPRVIRHLALGGPLDPAAVPPCAAVRALAAAARASGARLAAVERGRIVVVDPARGALPAGWARDGTEPDVLLTPRAGAVEHVVRIPVAGRYAVWLQGSFGRAVSVLANGRPVGSPAHALSGRDEYALAGAVALSRGVTRIELRRSGPGLRPGDGGPRRLGPVVLAPLAEAGSRVRTVDPSDWRSLCGRRLDWLEVVA